MSRQHNGSGQYLQVDASSVTTLPITLFAWLYPFEVTTDKWAIFLGNSGNDFKNISFGLADDGAMHLTTKDDSGTFLDLLIAGYLPNKWNAVSAVFASTTSRTAWLNGQFVTDTTSVTLDTTNFARTTIGRYASSAPFGDFNGLVHWPAIWQCALTSGEQMQLLRGANPLSIRRSALKNFWPRNSQGTEVDIISGNNLTVTGATVSRLSPVRKKPLARVLYNPSTYNYVNLERSHRGMFRGMGLGV